MKIRKIALVGAFLLTLGCVVLYLMLDVTLPHDSRQVSTVILTLKHNKITIG